MVKLSVQTALLISLTLAARLAGPQSVKELRQYVGQTHRVCGTVVTYSYPAKSGSGDCGAKLYIANAQHPQFYVLIPNDAAAAFPASPEVLYQTHDICVTGVVEADKKHSFHIIARTPSQMEVTDTQPLTHFAAGARRSCEAGVSPPKLLHEVKPSYPSADFVRRQIEDTVFLEAVIGTDGSVTETRVIGGRYPELNTEAEKALRAWRFQPAFINKTPVTFLAQIQIDFILRAR
jgi:TonB family protein